MMIGTNNGFILSFDDIMYNWEASICCDGTSKVPLRWVLKFNIDKAARGKSEGQRGLEWCFMIAKRKFQRCSLRASALRNKESNERKRWLS